MNVQTEASNFPSVFLNLQIDYEIDTHGNCIYYSKEQILVRSFIVLLYVLPPQRTRFSMFFFPQCKCGHLSPVMTFELFRVFVLEKFFTSQLFIYHICKMQYSVKMTFFVCGNLFKYKERNIIRWSQEKYKVISIAVFFYSPICISCAFGPMFLSLLWLVRYCPPDYYSAGNSSYTFKHICHDKLRPS